MKTLIFILAAALASPALGDGKTTTTETSSTSTTTSSPESYSGSGSMSGSGASADATTLESESVDSQDSSLSGSATSDYESDSSMSGSSSDSSMSGSSSDYQSGSATSDTATGSESSLSGSGSDMGATTTTTPSTTDTSSSLSGAATAPSATAPTMAPSQTTNVIVPPASATAAPAAPPEQASRTYREEEDGGLRAGGFYLEPAVFGSQQENDFKGPSAGAAPTTDANGFGLDLKLGGHINESFFLAADARYERATLQDEAFEDTDADVYNWGPVIGFQAPKYGLRAWGTYVVDGIYNPESAANGVDLEFKNPYGWRGGIGVRFEAVSVNLEYEDLTYRTTEIDSFGALANEAAADVDFVQRGASLSLSFPVEL